jgi:acetyl-CoA carboxylase biotin carboxyl carrier protein
MTNEEIKELLQIFNDSGVGEMELQRDGDTLRIRRSGESVSSAPVHTVTTHVAAPSEPPAKMAPEPTANQVLVKSPIVGTFYEASSPGTPPFVKVGDTVQPGQVLCIIESMKLMNEIEAEAGGVIAAKLVENGKPVEYGQALFAIEPHA